MGRHIVVKVNHGIPGHDPGSTVRVEVDSDGNVFDRFWRRRLRDAAIDGCCEVVNESRSSKAKLKPSSADEEKVDG